jgi:hypothetical protein
MDNKVLNSEETQDYKVKVLKQKCEYLYKHGKSFTLVKSGGTYELVSSLWNEKAAARGFRADDLAFINKVRNHVEKNNIVVDFIDTYYKGEDIQYVKVKDYAVGEEIQDLVYIDINGAYWQTAHHLGIINDALYLKGLEINKVVRLAALGSLAKTKDIWKYDGKDFKKTETIRNPNENLWFAICKRVSDVMIEVVNKVGDDFVFYWVDGIYIKNKPEVVALVYKTFSDLGYTTKTEPIPYIKFHEKGFDVQGAIKGDLKHFSWICEGKDKGGAKSKPISEYLENKRLLKVMQDALYSNEGRKVPAKKKKGAK